ncbi:hypothetical protein VPZ86_001273 [Salmonella enterica]|nr:hypothetical protein [Salmonella enterica]EBE2443176.1 hypothetical protein [Salmonella enterica subsp. enterica serovar Infantis]ECJ4225723.1 hypothetical protein [Salmonella enterica subsp. enterica]EHR3000096.1 hypothetical protein [Salmonella enterica subsp. enterica serovar Saintpaul]EKR1709221.1 hypothetical protein [Salmonella enterica subsp. enterica serovar Carrau]
MKDPILVKQLELMDELCQKELSQPLENFPPKAFSSEEAQSCFWPLGEFFRPYIHQIETVHYRKQAEPDANRAIRDFVLYKKKWDNLPLIVWRVLLERYRQLQTVITLNIAAGNHRFMVLPVDVSNPLKLRFAVAGQLYAMKLPYKVNDQSLPDIDSLFAHRPPALH